MFGTENHHTKLRVRTLLELTNNENFNTNAIHLNTMSFEHAANQTNVFEYVIETYVADSSLRRGGTSLVE